MTVEEWRRRMRQADKEADEQLRIRRGILLIALLTVLMIGVHAYNKSMLRGQRAESTIEAR